MKTRILSTTENDIAEAAGIIQQGGLVAFPTETVYGLGADALNAENIGISFLDSGLMVPLKSMMGIIKIGEKRAKKCLDCVASDNCRFRNNGTFCFITEK